MQLLKNYKELKASSLVESVIAISIISICALSAFMIYLNVINNNKSIYYYKAKHKIDLLCYESEKYLDYEDDVYKYNGYTITKKVTINEVDRTAILSFLVKIRDREFEINKLVSHNE